MIELFQFSVVTSKDGLTQIRLDTNNLINDEQKVHLLEENKKNHVSVPNLNQDYEKANGNVELAQKDRSKSIDVTQISELNPIEVRIASIMSLGNVGGDANVIEARERIRSGKWYAFLFLNPKFE